MWHYYLIVIVFSWGFHFNVVSKMYDMEPIRISLTGDVMENITKCNNYPHDKLLPKEIHIVMMGSASYLKDYKFQVESVQEYSNIHGYNFHTADPGLIMTKFGSMPADHGFPNTPHIVASKTLLIYCELFQYM